MWGGRDEGGRTVEGTYKKERGTKPSSLLHEVGVARVEVHCRDHRHKVEVLRVAYK